MTRRLRPRRTCAGPLVTVAAMLFLFASATLGQGGPPLVTDDPATPGDRRWEINLAFVAETRAGERHLEAPLVDANYGWGERIQLKVEIPWVIRSADGGPTRNGLGNALFGVKWRFADEEKSGIGVAFYPQAEVNMLSSSARRGLAEKRTGLFLPLALERKLGPLSVNVEIGHEFREGEKSRWFGGLALGRQISRQLELLVEVFGKASSGLGGAESSWNFGGRWKTGRRLVFLFSAGTGIGGSAGNPRARFLCYAGSQFLF